MYLTNTLLWIFIALLVSAVVFAIVFAIGSRTTWRLYTSFNAKGSQENSSRDPHAPTPGQSLSSDDGITHSPEEITDAVLKKEYESVNIGGAVVLVQTTPDIPQEEVAIIFERVEDKEALVNLALNNKVKIQEVRLLTINPKPPREFAISMIVKNQTSKELRIKIPKGQVFENKQVTPRRQNLAAAKEDVIILPVSTDPDAPGIPINIVALCINKGFDPPNGSFGNITIFELRNKGFIDQKDLWYWIEEKLEGITTPS